GLFRRGAVTITNTSGVTSFATLTTSATDNVISPLTGQTVGLPTLNQGTLNFLQTDSGTLGAGTNTANSLQITTTQDGQSLNLGGGTLALTSGALLFTGANAYSITNGTINATASAGDIAIRNYGTGGLTLGA